MKVGLITIGGELLNGTRTDTNASWIGQSIEAVGANIDWHMTVNDNAESILSSLDQVPKEIGYLLCTGGLGPTHDDITASVLYKYFDSKSVFDESYWQLLIERFKSRGKDIPLSNKNQAMIPEEGKVIPNPIGTARGLHFKNKNYELFSMPGVPSEMKYMMTNYILPIIDNHSEKNHIKMIRTTGIMESSLYEIIHPYLNTDEKVKIAFLPRFTGVDLRISSKDINYLNKFFSKILPLIDKYYYGNNNEELEDIVGKILIDQNKSISTAESCSGGLISDRFTNTPNSSNYFKGGIVAYSNKIKTDILGVNEDLLTKTGAVSEPVALEMARGARKAFNVDIGLSCTGIAGPSGGSKSKPVGLVYIALSSVDYEKVYCFNFTKDRKTNKLMTSQTALNILRLYLIKND